MLYYQKKFQPIVKGQKVLSGFLYKSCILCNVLEQIWTQWLTLTAIFFVQQGSKTISWQTERTLYLQWSTLVSSLKTSQNILHFNWRFLTCSANVGLFSVVSNSTSKSRQLCETFLESKEVFCSIVVHCVTDYYAHLLFCCKPG